MAERRQLTDAVDSEELADLQLRWPLAMRRHVRLEVDDPFLTGEHQELLSDGRRAEICYVAYERDPESGVLLHVKTIYPSIAYRLPTGGIAPGETVWDTLIREIPEETGLEMGEGPDQVRMDRMLGVLSYEFVHAHLKRTFPFATYIFLVEFPDDAVISPRDPTERIADWRWNTPQELNGVAETLAGLELYAPNWADWGRFRSLSHRLVAEALS
jgi:8-oxo-dGTP pyrophosphatase MutT (NUDIX family)